MKTYASKKNKRIASETSNTISAWLPIAVSILVSALLSVYPLGSVLANMRPMFLFVVTIFWVLHRPWLVGIWFALITGLLSDLLLDTQVGQQAIASVLSIFVLQLMSASSKQIADVQAWFLASVSIIVYSLILLALQIPDGQLVLWRSGLPMITGILIWPLVVLLLKRH